jgi:hypothetical protein
METPAAQRGIAVVLAEDAASNFRMEISISMRREPSYINDVPPLLFEPPVAVVPPLPEPPGPLVPPPRVPPVALTPLLLEPPDPRIPPLPAPPEPLTLPPPAPWDGNRAMQLYLPST